jgi:hypothetical protein
LKSPLRSCVTITFPPLSRDGNRFIVRAEEILTAFVELEAARETGLV